jgi:hypothetical protein
MTAKFEFFPKETGLSVNVSSQNSPAGTEVNHDKQRKFELRTPACPAYVTLAGRLSPLIPDTQPCFTSSTPSNAEIN